MIYKAEVLISLLIASLCGREVFGAPNIVFVLLDDVGWRYVKISVAHTALSTKDY